MPDRYCVRKKNEIKFRPLRGLGKLNVVAKVGTRVDL
jgi:hypothetical protein